MFVPNHDGYINNAWVRDGGSGEGNHPAVRQADYHDLRLNNIFNYYYFLARCFK